ncbi:hypothetical protein EHQ86_18585 [Leptospira yasudae]|nr:hypothetical protein EHQ86_18585 [Leptospira yasudae]
MTHSIDFILKESIATVRNLNKLLQRDILILVAIFAVYILRSSDSVSLSYVTIKVNSKDAIIGLWLATSLIGVTLISHSNKIYILLKVIDKIVKSNLEGLDNQSEGSGLIIKSQLESAYYISDNFVSDFLVTGSDRIPSFRRLIFLNLSFTLILFFINAHFFNKVFEFPRYCFYNQTLYWVILLSFCILLDLLLIYIGVFKKAIHEQKKAIQFQLAQALIATSEVEDGVSNIYEINWDRPMQKFRDSLKNREYLSNIFEDKLFESKVGSYINLLRSNLHGLETKQLELIAEKKTKNNVNEINALERKISAIQNLLHSINRFSEQYDISLNSNILGRFLIYNGIRYDIPNPNFKNFLWAILIYIVSFA